MLLRLMQGIVFNGLAARWFVAALALLLPTGGFSFQVLVNLSTYAKHDTNAVRDVRLLKCDGVWAIPQNDGGTFSPAD
jgi:hypothetical protein